MNPDELYNYFTPLESAIAAVFEAQEFIIWTPLRDLKFQKERPRVEAVLMPGAALGFLRSEPSRIARCGFLREKARRATLSIFVVTEANVVTHRAFLARTLFVLDTIGYEMNKTALMPYHSVQSVKVNSGSLSDDATTGAYTTTLNCDLDFSFKEATWLLLDDYIAQTP